MYGVTVTTPPKSELFSCFFKSFSGSSVKPLEDLDPAPVVVPATQAVDHTQASVKQVAMQLFGPFLGVLTGQLFQAWQAPILPLALPSPTKLDNVPPALPSPTKADYSIEGIHYPDIADFLKELQDADPHCNLTAHAEAFLSKDFFSINELVNFKAMELEEEFGLSSGNANHVLDKIKAVVMKL